MEKYQLTVIGGGPAGMACAASAYRQGLSRVLLLERRTFTGGILRQCIHDGFGLLSGGRNLTGPEFAEQLAENLNETKVQVCTGAYVSDVSYEKRPYRVTYITREGTIEEIETESVVLATGCREKPFGSLRIPGTRPSGIFSAGTAQYMMNVQNILPGRSAVILGLGDIGMIMARRLTLEGARVKLICGLEKTGLPRNFSRCIEDFEIPWREHCRVVSVHGKKRLKGVTVAPVGPDGKPVFSEKEYIPCDTLLVAAGLLPEDELCPETVQEGVFRCGNVDHIYSLVDHVKEAGEYTALLAARFVLGTEKSGETLLSEAEERMKRQQEELCGFQGGDALICGECPMSCRLMVKEIRTPEGEISVRVSGNRCPRGEAFAKQEYRQPKRILTTTVKTEGSRFSLLPVRSSRPIPREQLADAVKELRRIRVPETVSCGDVIAENILGTGADLVAAGTVCHDRQETVL